MTVLKTFVTAAFVITSAGAMAETGYPSEHMTATVEALPAHSPATLTAVDAVEARNAVTARPSPVAPVSVADPLYRSDDYPNNTGWHRAAVAQQARGGNPEQAWAGINQRPSPIAPAAPADPDFVPLHLN
jgi:hypothetical protein